MITTNKLDPENMFLVIEHLQPLGARCGRESRLYINLSNTSNRQITLHNALANKGLVLLWLIEPPNQRPNLKECTNSKLIESPKQ